MNGPAEIFDRRLRRIRRDRAATRGGAFLRGLIVDELLDRLESVQRRFTRVLDLGCGDGALAAALRARGAEVFAVDAGIAFARASGGVAGEEDRLPIADRSVDLVTSAGVLDQVNDLPGAMALARRALTPDGLFLAGFFGAGSLPRLRAAALAADLAGSSGVAARLHPQIDLRAAGDLLSRVGYALPVADAVSLTVRYPGLDALVADLRDAAATNLLVARSRTPLNRVQLAAARARFLADADPDGRVAERLEIICMTGWSPDASQPQPARRGSASASLAAALAPPAKPITPAPREGR